MNIGKKIRLSRIIDDKGRTIIVPIDHAVEGYFQELEDPERLIKEFILGGANAILLRRGMLERTYNIIAGKLGIVYRVSGATGSSPDVTDQRLIASVYEALKRGADAVIFTVYTGHPKENDMYTLFGELSDKAYELNMPLIGEVDTWPSSQENKGELLRQGVRYLSEEGADLIKTYFPDDENYYKKIIKYSLAPVVAAGGPKMPEPKDVLWFAKKVIDSGAIGVSFGRNVWQYSSPSKMVRALSAIIKEGKDVHEAEQLL